MLIPRPCEAETRRISKTFSGPQCFDGDEALISSKDPDLGDRDGDFVMDNVWRNIEHGEIFALSALVLDKKRTNFGHTVDKIYNLN